MKILYFLFFALFAVGAYSSECLFSQSPPAAVNVLGQPNFTSTGQGIGLNELKLPTRMAIDYNNNKLFVCDTYNFRMLRYSLDAITTNGAHAEMQLGSGLSECNGNSIRPVDVAIDGNGNCWVSDSFSGRVLLLANCSTATNMTILKILGQPNSTFCSYGNELNKISSPTGLFLDKQNDRLWVSDDENHRVLRFDNISTISTGAYASAYLGSESIGTCAEEYLRHPEGLWLNSMGTEGWLYI